jgi:hypothetical protein
MGWYREYRKRLTFFSAGWDNSRSAIWANPKRNGRCIGAEKNPANGDSGIYSLQEIHDAAYSTGGLEFLDSYSFGRINGFDNTITYATHFTSATVSSGDIIVCVYGRGNSSGYYDTNTPSERTGDWTFVPGAAHGGDDSYDHDHAIFYHTIGAGETSVTFEADNLGTPSYQAAAWHYFLFRGATGVDSGARTLKNNYSRVNSTGNNSTSLEANQFIVFSHANAVYNTNHSVSTDAANYEATPGMLSNLGNDTDDINMQSWLYKATATETWTNPAFTATSNSTASDSTLVSVRVY